MRVLLGVDVGTSSTKGVLVRTDGAVLSTAVRSHSVQHPRPGHYEMDPEIWWDEFESICEELTGGGDIEVIAVGVSGMGPCAVVTDHAGVPARAAILYGVDTRATAQITRLNEELGRDEILARTANVLSSQSVGPKLMWILDNEPEALDHAERLFMPSSWIGFRLTGEYAMDFHSASQCTPLYDSRADTWDVEWATRIAPWLHLPELKWSGEVLGTTRTAIAGVKPGTPVLMGTIDAWAESVSVGADRPGRLMLMYGTTMFMIASTDRRLASERLWATRGVDPNSSSLAGGLATAGSLTAWSRELLREHDFTALTAAAEQSGPGARGLLLLPYFAGERTPILDPNAAGVLAGLTLRHDAGDIFRAVLEGTALAVRNNLEAMRDLGVAIDQATAVGGGTQAREWVQIVSDVTGIPQVIPRSTVGASFGMAMLAARASGLNVEVDDWNPAAEVVVPDESHRSLYDDRYRLFVELYQATAPVVHSLAASER